MIEGIQERGYKGRDLREGVQGREHKGGQIGEGIQGRYMREQYSLQGCCICETPL